MFAARYPRNLKRWVHEPTIFDLYVCTKFNFCFFALTLAGFNIVGCGGSHGIDTGL